MRTRHLFCVFLVWQPSRRFCRSRGATSGEWEPIVTGSALDWTRGKFVVHLSCNLVRLSHLFVVLFLVVFQDILADDGVGGKEERRKRLFVGLKFFFGREVGHGVSFCGVCACITRGA